MEAAANFTGCIKTFDGFAEDIENLQIFIDL